MALRLISGIGAAAGENIGKLFEEAKKLYDPKGEFMAGTEATISRGSKRAIASGVQQLASAGLAGTSIIGGLGKKYEEEVGMPARARATTQRLSALSNLLTQEAGMETQFAPRISTQETIAPPQLQQVYSKPSRSSYTPSWQRMGAQPQAQSAQPQQQVTRRPGFGRAPERRPPLNLYGFRQQQQQTPARKLQTYGPPAPTSKRPLSQYYDVGGELGI